MAWFSFSGLVNKPDFSLGTIKFWAKLKLKCQLVALSVCLGSQASLFIMREQISNPIRQSNVPIQNTKLPKRLCPAWRVSDALKEFSSSPNLQRLESLTSQADATPQPTAVTGRNQDGHPTRHSRLYLLLLRDESVSGGIRQQTEKVWNKSITNRTHRNDAQRPACMQNSCISEQFNKLNKTSGLWCCSGLTTPCWW